MFKVPNISAGVGISAEGDVGDDPKARKEQLFSPKWRRRHLRKFYLFYSKFEIFQHV